jgi:TPR repeat protein
MSDKKYPPAQYLYSIFSQKHNLQSSSIFTTLLEGANEGFAPAQNHLGNIYSKGLLGTKKDLKIAFEWYKKSAENGFPSGQNNLGNCYFTGEGIEKNLISARFWFEKAAEQGNSIAINNLKTLQFTN